ncbi:hypothetical protein, partial [Nocardia brasiliensis]|uniref:hypothetical protein n=1 Tax=Nocardia brasiliensis TaxID=37326 RepID=UPI002454F2E1
PYESRELPHDPAGEQMAQRVLQAMSAPEVQASIMASPFAAVSVLKAAIVRSRLWDRHPKVLDTLAALVPCKGGEADRLAAVYLTRQATRPEQALLLATRDYYGLTLCSLAFPRTDATVLTLIGALDCLMLAPDFVGVADGAGSPTADAYAIAASEAITCLHGAGVDEYLRECGLLGACIKAHPAIVAATAHLADPERFIAQAGGPVTPVESMWARWCDGLVSTITRLPLSTPAYQHISNARGTLPAYHTCPAIQRAVDLEIHYNCVLDIVNDWINQECQNELSLALALGGGRAGLGLGNAFARVVDDTLACRCGHPGHAEAAELAMGFCLFYLINPRWRAREQLLALTADTSPVADMYRWQAPRTRLRDVAQTTLSPGGALYSTAWKPLWHNDIHAGDRWLKELTQRSITRSLLAIDTLPSNALGACRTAAQSAITAAGTSDTPHELGAAAQHWLRYFDTILDAALPCTTPEHGVAARHLRPLITRIWQQIIVGSTPRTPTGRIDEQLHIDTAHTILRTYALPPAEGLALRRAFVGIATSAVELAGLNPYNRLTNGISHILLQNQDNRQ